MQFFEECQMFSADLSKFVEFCVGLHAAEADFWEGLSPVGPCQRPVEDGTTARLFGQERFRYPKIGW